MTSVVDLSRTEWATLSKVLEEPGRLTPPREENLAVALLRDAFERALAKDAALLVREVCGPGDAPEDSASFEAGCAELRRLGAQAWDPEKVLLASHIRKVMRGDGAAESAPQAPEEQSIEELDMEGLRCRVAELAVTAANLGGPEGRRIRRLLEEAHQEARTRLRAQIRVRYMPRNEWLVPLTKEMALSPDRPEFAFFGLVMPQKSAELPKPGQIPHHVRSRAIDLLGNLGGRFTPVQYAMLLDELVETWDPFAQTLFERYPELVARAVEVAGEVEYFRRCAEEFPSLHAAELQADFLRMAGASPGRAQIAANDILGRRMLAARENVSFKEAWTAHENPDEMRYAERRDDYLFFCERLGTDPDLGLRDEALVAETRRLGRDWIQRVTAFATESCIRAIGAAGSRRYLTRAIMDELRAEVPSTGKTGRAEAKASEPQTKRLSFPSALQNTTIRSKVLAKLSHEVFAARSRGQPISSQLMSALEWYPELVSDLLANGALSPKEVRPLLAKPVFGFHVLMENFARHVGWLELQLLASAEAAELILSERRRVAGGPTHADDAYLECMADDPNRLIRNLGADEGSQRRRESIRRESLRRQSDGPAWAFCYLESFPATTISDSLVATLTGSDECAWMAARFLRERQAGEADWSPLLAKVESPRWAFHILRDNLGGRHTARLLHVISRSPPWMAEYCDAARIRGSALDRLYCETARRSANHPTVEELDNWYLETALRGLDLRFGLAA